MTNQIFHSKKAMKKSFSIYLLSILIFLGLLTNGQNRDYIPLLNFENTWSILHDYSAGGWPLQSFYLRINDSTVFKSGREYYNVYQTYDSTGLEDTWNQIGYLSENADEQQCYFMNMNMLEGLIYDFSATEGDTLNMWNTIYQNEPAEVVVLEKDSILLGGRYRNRLHIQDVFWNKSEDWIEGIGSSKGLLFSCFNLIGGLHSLLCFFENDSLIYHLDEYETCYYGLNTGTIENSDKSMFSIYPNPVKDGQALMINIQSVNETTISTLYLYNLIGCCIDTRQFRGSNCSYYSPTHQKGLYVLKIQNDYFDHSVKINLK